jgi:hypothetical protein
MGLTNPATLLDALELDLPQAEPPDAEPPALDPKLALDDAHDDYRYTGSGPGGAHEHIAVHY